MAFAGLIGCCLAGLYALEHHVGKLADDHANAQALALGLSQIPGQHTCATHALLPLVIDFEWCLYDRYLMRPTYVQDEHCIF